MTNHPNRSKTPVGRAKQRLTAAIDRLNTALEGGCTAMESKRLRQAMLAAHAKYNEAVAAAADHKSELAGIRSVAHLI